MGMTYAGKVAIDPEELASSIIDAGDNSPLNPWWLVANSFISPLGFTPGTGMVLLKYSDLQAISYNQVNPLVIASPDGSTVTFPSILIRKYQLATSTWDGDPNAPVVVWLTDQRWRWRRIPIDRAYNVWNDAGAAYYTATTDSGTPWTWTGMFEDVWGTISGLGAAPALPYSPDGVPENFSFYGGTTWEALRIILERLECTLRYDPIADAYSVVSLNNQVDATTETLLGTLQAAGLLVKDSKPTLPAFTWLPAAVRTLFLNSPAPTDGTTPYYYIDTEDTSPLTGQDPTTIVTVLDDMPALGGASGGTPSNLAAMSSRAIEVAAKWFLRNRIWSDPEDQHYANVQPAMNNWTQLLALAFTELSEAAGIRTEMMHGNGPVEDLLPRALRIDDPLQLKPICSLLGQHALVRDVPSFVRTAATSAGDSIEVVGGISGDITGVTKLTLPYFTVVGPSSGATATIAPPVLTAGNVVNPAGESITGTGELIGSAYFLTVPAGVYDLHLHITYQYTPAAGTNSMNLNFAMRNITAGVNMLESGPYYVYDTNGPTGIFNIERTFHVDVYRSIFAVPTKLSYFMNIAQGTLDVTYVTEASIVAIKWPY